MATLSLVQPETFEQAAEVLAEMTRAGRSVRIAGAGTKSWGTPAAPGDDDLQLGTTGLSEIVAHDPGDMTATLQAGVSLQRARERFAQADQMLALDVPTGDDGSPGEATIGGAVATGDSGPLAHRYGGPRDLVVGMTVALADGTIARSGGTVIKNVAGYDIAKLFCGAFGTLGLILSVNVRLHPRRPTVTATGTADDARDLCAAARRLAGMPAELEALDLAWQNTTGTLLARCAGAQAGPRGRRVAEAMTAAGCAAVEVHEDDEPLWERQRARQRSTSEAVLRVAAAPVALPGVIGAAQRVGARLVGRASLGQMYVTLAPERVAALRERLPDGAVSVLQDCPAQARAQISEPWGDTPAPALELMRALKRRFDPTATCNPGTFVGSI